jgi:hypothetical protein
MPIAEWSGFDYAHVVNATHPNLRPMGEAYSMGEQINLDGCMFRATLNDGTVQSYVQVFRNGCIEAVLTAIGHGKPKLIIPDSEVTLRAGLDRYRKALVALGIAPPYYVALSLVNVGGYTMDLANRYDFIGTEPVVIDRPHLLLPEVPVDSEAISLDAIVRPLFNLIWNACGYLGSPHFKPDGSWKGSPG